MTSFTIGDAHVIMEASGATPAQPQVAAEKTDSSPAEQPPTEPDTNKEKDKEDKEEKDKQEEKEAAAIQRPKVPPRVPDPREFDVRPGKDARIRFNFHGQPWPDLLQWLAVIGRHSLDWQELPGDYVNISTERAYTIPETRDVFNRLLLERGYTMVLQGDVMMVVKLDKLDPSLLPRVEDESELSDLPAHEMVKITFQLPDKLKADQAAADIKPLLSPNAKVQPLMATNRLLVIDIVTNLREVSRLINAEHAAAIGNVVPREFPIRFARADQVADQIMILLGLDPSSRRTPQELQVEQQRLQLFTQMQQKGKSVDKFLRKSDSPAVYLAVNHRNNSILANAPAAEMQIIQRTVEMLDTPSGSLAGAMPTALTMEKYQLVTLSPQSIVTALEEMGALDPRTRLKIDSDASTVFANATTRDHATIRAMIDRLDGTGRQFEVIWLRRLPADAVAKTVHNLMIGDDKKKNNDRQSYFYYGYGGSSRQGKDKPNAGFRVDADIQNNRLLLWANDLELREVRRFLEKLGEIPGNSGNPNTVRLLDVRDAAATRALIERVRRVWPSIGENELRIEGTLPTDEDARSQEREPRTDDKAAASHGPVRPVTWLARGTGQAVPPPADFSPQLVQVRPREMETSENSERLSRDFPIAENGQSSNQSTNDASAPAPITISVNDEGRVQLSSLDTQALDRLEELLAQIAPPPKDYEVFYLRYALASLVLANLEEYFEEDGDSDNDAQRNFMRGWFGIDMPSGNQESGGIGLAKKQKIRFIYDYDTNSVLVSNASPSQLATVKELIDVYDQPPSEDSISARRFQIFKLDFARADRVAKTIKEVYRDLLSSKDKEFENAKAKGEKEQSSQANSFYRIYGSDDSPKKDAKTVKASFAGALSVGVDEVSNTVIISAQEEWMTSISEMIKYLDQEASPHVSTVQVLETRIDPRILKAALSTVMGSEDVQPRGPREPAIERPPAESQDSNSGQPRSKDGG